MEVLQTLWPQLGIGFFLGYSVSSSFLAVHAMSGIPLPWSALGGIFESVPDPLPISNDMTELGDIVRKHAKFDAILRAFDAQNPSWVTECAAAIMATRSPILSALLAAGELPQANTYQRYGMALAYLAVHGTDDQLWQGLGWLPDQWPERFYPQLFSLAFNQIIIFIEEDASAVANLNDDDVDYSLSETAARFAKALLSFNQCYFDEFLSADAAVIASLIRRGDWPLYGPVCDTLWDLAWHGDAVPQTVIKSVPSILRAALEANQPAFLYKVSRESYDLRPDCAANQDAATAVLWSGEASALLAEYILKQRLVTADQLAGSPCYLFALKASNGPLISLYDEYNIPLLPRSMVDAEAKERWSLVHDFKMMILEVANTSTLETLLGTLAFRSSIGQDYAGTVALLRERARRHFPDEKLRLLSAYVTTVPMSNLVASGVKIESLRADAIQHNDLVLLEYLDEFAPLPAPPPSPVSVTPAAAAVPAPRNKRRQAALELGQNFCIADRVKRRKDRSDGAPPPSRARRGGARGRSGH